jgi:methylated-DNA-[protein]-cysteine S-methyltransferase
MRYDEIDSPVGPLLVAADEAGLRLIHFQAGRHRRRPDPSWRRDPEAFLSLARQLGEYFRRERRAFDLPLAPKGTPFQLATWRALSTIPYGETISYAELARRVRRPGAARAVGAANGRNPLPIVVPCHRVIGTDGSLTGFGGGLEKKRALLDLEGAPCVAAAGQLTLSLERKPGRLVQTAHAGSGRRA